MLIFSTLPSNLPPKGWDLRSYIFLALFTIWWPGLYVMYTHMMKQRKKAIGKGFWGDKRAQEKAQQRQKMIREAAAQAGKKSK